MKHSGLVWISIAAILVCASTSSPHAREAPPLHGYFRALPLHGSGNLSGASSAAELAAAAVSSVPLWNYTQIASRDRKTYKGMMVGRSPFFHGARTTNINAILVPVKITFKSGGMVFDPDQTDATCLPNGTVTATSLTQGSPILMRANFRMNGVDEEDTQYFDAFQRANFFDAVNPTGDSYHTLLNLTDTVSATVSIAASSGKVFSADSLGSCAPVGVMNVNTFQNIVEKTLIPGLAAQGVGPTNVPIFLLYNVVMSEGPPKGNPPTNCCILGYHSAVQKSSRIQLYAVADYDSSQAFEGSPPSGLNSAILSHEIAELHDDPLGTNATPAWGNGVGQLPPGVCQKNLEVADPLSGTFLPEVTMPNGITYDLQELAFYSWFFGAPSIGAGGLFSDNGSFTTDAGAICK